MQPKARSNIKTLEREKNFHDEVRTILRDDHVGYVLVTCRQTGQAGKLEVEVSYEGEPDLACYLVDGAQGYFENELTLGEA
jgi:hypothetical protein